MKRAKKKNENKVEYGTVSLPLPLVKKIQEKIKGTGMNSVSGYVSFVLREILASESKELFSGEDKKEIRAKLKKLGYY